MEMLTIGQVAQHAGLGVETVRFYEREGLIEEPQRRASGYRQFSVDVIPRLQVIKRARAVGFSLREIKQLLSLRADDDTTCAEVRRQAQSKIEEIDQKLQDLQRMRAALGALVEDRERRGGVECPFLEALAAQEEEQQAHRVDEVATDLRRSSTTPRRPPIRNRR